MTTKHSRLYLKLLLVSALVMIVATPLYFLPSVTGGSFVRATLQTVYLSVSAPSNEHVFQVQGDDNMTHDVSGLAFNIQVSNSYFLPVTVRYGGPDLEVQVYNKVLGATSDASSDSHVIWKVTASADLGDEDNVRYPTTTDLVEHVTSIPAGVVTFSFADNSTSWSGFDASAGMLAFPGDYYIYATAFGRTTPPVHIRILSQ